MPQLAPLFWVGVTVSLFLVVSLVCVGVWWGRKDVLVFRAEGVCCEASGGGVWCW
uniref:ATP synthase F0 subunit 8 n=1 Tax=Notospermus geniculatus TaxID=416868 RepID=A0A4Y5RV60_9BILA|nr:ATP synthase F0 subunit 8 [Notospermus geniculatus]QCZ36409.1 ATP synthase F0 subunit 8 [Notospermus geniculatus]